MTVGAKGAASENKTVAGVIIGCVAAQMLSVAIIAVVAALISSEKIGQEGMGAAAYVVLFISSLLGCILAGKITGNKPALVCTVTAAAYALILTGCCVFFFDSLFRNFWPKLGAILAGGIISCLLLARKGRGRRRRSR